VFALDGSRIVTASDVAPARLWDRDGKPLATLQGQAGVNSAVFSPDGRSILIASDYPAVGGVSRSASTGRSRQGRAPRCLIPEQRERLFLAPSHRAGARTCTSGPTAGPIYHSTDKPIGCSEEGGALDGTKSLFREAQHRCIRTLSLRYKPLIGGTVHSLWLWGKRFKNI
jgi:hypothetical protein